MTSIEQNDDQPVTRGEFRRWRKRALTGYAVLAVAAAASTALLVDVLQKFETESLNRDAAIHSSQIAACKDLTGKESANRTAVLRVMRNHNRFLRADIKDQKNIPPEFFPDIPRAEFERLVREGIRSSRGTIKENKETIAALIGQTACEKRYAETLPES